MFEFLFGARKRKKSRARRYNVPNSPCNRLKRKDCRAKSPKCSYVKRRGCRRGKGYGWMVIIQLPQVQAQISQQAQAAQAAAVAAGAPPEAQVVAAAAAAADTATENIIAANGTEADARAAAINAARKAAIAASQSLPSIERTRYVRNAVKAIQGGQSKAAPAVPTEAQVIAAAVKAATRVTRNAAADPNRPTYANIKAAAINAARSAAVETARPIPMNERRRSLRNAMKTVQEALDRGESRGAPSAPPLDGQEDTGEEIVYRPRPQQFGRRFRFGSVCTELRPQDGPTCMRYNVNGMYPCNWSGGQNSRCQKRSGGPVSYAKARAGTHGHYMDYAQATVPALATMVPPPQPPPVTQGLFPFAGFFPFDEERATPSAPPLDNEEDTGEEIVYRPRGRPVPSAPPLDSPQSSSWRSSPMSSPYFSGGGNSATDTGCKSIKDQRVCNGNANCSWLGGKVNACQRKRGTVKDSLVFYGPNVQFGKKRRRKGCKGRTKKLPAKIRKLCKRLKIKTTKRVGGRRVCKSIKTLMKQIKKRMKKSKKCRRRR